MTRRQRRAHAVAWTILAPSLLAALVATILLRPVPPQPNAVPEAEAAPLLLDVEEASQ